MVSVKEYLIDLELDKKNKYTNNKKEEIIEMLKQILNNSNLMK